VSQLGKSYPAEQKAEKQKAVMDHVWSNVERVDHAEIAHSAKDSVKSFKRKENYPEADPFQGCADEAAVRFSGLPQRIDHTDYDSDYQSL